MTEPIIVGYDGSSEADDALALARTLADATGVGVVLARVSPEVETDRIEAELSEVAASNGAEISAVPGDRPVEGLRDLSEELHARLLVVGSTHRAGIGTVLLGSVGQRLLQDAPCAVAVAPRGFRDQAPGNPRVVAVAFDGSPEASEALAAAADLATQAKATIRLLAVDRPTPGGAAPSTLRDDLLRARDRLPVTLRAAAALRHGRPAPAIVDEAEKGVDVLFVGSRGRGPLRRAMLGSVSSELMSTAPCPVIVTPRSAVAPSRSPDSAVGAQT